MANLTQPSTSHPPGQKPNRRRSSTHATGGTGAYRPRGAPTSAHTDSNYYRPQPTATEANELTNLNANSQATSAAATPRYVPSGRGRKNKGGNFLKRQKRKLITGAILGSLGVTGIGGFFFLQGPFQLIHLAQLLQQFHFSNNEDAQDLRATKIISYLKYPKSPEMRRLGPVGNRLANNITTRLGNQGITLNYEGGFFNRLTSIDLPEGISNADIKRYQAEGFDVDTSRSPPRVNLSDSDFGFRRGAVRFVVGDIVGIGKVSAATHSRVLIRRAGVKFSVFNKVNRAADESADAWRQRYNKNRESEIKTGRSNVETPHIGVVAQPEIPNPVSAARRKIKKAAKGIGGVTAAFDVICTVKALGDEAEAIEHETITLRLIRVAMRIITAGNQIMSGDNIGSIEEIGHESSFLYDPGSKDPEDPRPPSSVMSARSMQYEMKEPLTGADVPANIKPGGSKNLASQITDPVPALGPACNAYSSGFLQTAIGLFDPLGYVADLFLNAVGAYDSVFEGLARLLAKEGAETNAIGALLGDYLNFGARHAADEQAIAFGGRELSDVEVAQLDSSAQESRRQYAQAKGWKYRWFNINNPESALATTLASAPQPTAKNILSAPAKMLANVKKLPSTLFTKTQAQSSTYDYGFPEFGFSVDELNNPQLDNPFANEETLFKGHNFDQRLKQLNDSYGKPCFNVTLNADGGFTHGDSRPYDEIDSKCKDKNNQELVRFRMYVLDTMTITAMDCYEGNEASCRLMGLGD